MIVIMPPGSIALVDWNIIEIPLTKSRHFVGFSIYDNVGRVSTPILEFDEATAEGKTESGSMYFMRGKPGNVHPDALYVLEGVTGYGKIVYNWVFPVESSSGEGLH